MTVTRVVDELGERGIVGVVRARSSRRALALASALVAGGIQAIEITFTVPAAATVIARMTEEHPGIMVGAGTVTTWDQLEAAVRAGSDFVVSPVHPKGFVEGALGQMVLPIPGCATPNEVWLALELRPSSSSRPPGWEVLPT